MVRKWLDKRRQEKEMERDIKARQAKKRVSRYIEKQRQMERKLWTLGKRAVQLGDERQFRQIGKQIVWTQDDVARWERYLLSMETLEARRDQARVTGEFLGSLQAMSESLLAGVTTESMVDIQKNLEMGLERAQGLEERLSLFMELAEDTFYDVDVWDERKFDDMQSAMLTEAETDEADRFDTQIEAGLKQIREEMRKR